MSVQLVWQAMTFQGFPKHPRAKIMLISLCNFADEQGHGWTANKTLADHCQCSVKHVRDLKHRLVQAGVVRFENRTGRGAKNRHYISLDVLASGQAKPAPTGATLDFGNSHLETPKPAPPAPETRTSGGDPIGIIEK